MSAQATPTATNSAPGETQTPPRIAFLTDIPTPYYNSVFSALAEISDLGVVFCSRGATRGLAWELRDTRQFRARMVDGLTIRRHRHDGTDYYLSPQIPRALVAEHPDIVISNGYSIPTVYAALYARARRAPLVIQTDGTAHSERDINRLQRLARRVLIPRASGFVGNSSQAVRRFVELGAPPTRVFLAPHSIAIEPFWAVASERRHRAGGPVRALTVGRLIPRKGLDRLLLALRRAQELGADIEMTVVGPGPEESRLKRMAHELRLRVDFAGFTDQDELPARYADADLFVFPTLDDPFGMVLLEAAASGLPLVSSPWAGATDDLVEPGETGFVADPADIDAFADAMARLATDPALRERMGQRAYERTLDRTPAHAARGYLEAAQATLAAAPARRYATERGTRD